MGDLNLVERLENLDKILPDVESLGRIDDVKLIGGSRVNYVGIVDGRPLVINYIHLLILDNMNYCF